MSKIIGLNRYKNHRLTNFLKNYLCQIIFQAAMDRTTTEVVEDPSKSSYALKLVKENESLKGKLAQLESSAPMCFHGKHLPPNSTSSPSCQEDVRTCIEQSHANFQHQQSHIKSQVIFLFSDF